jgi:hypothetical protein
VTKQDRVMLHHCYLILSYCYCVEIYLNWKVITHLDLCCGRMAERLLYQIATHYLLIEDLCALLSEQLKLFTMAFNLIFVLCNSSAPYAADKC